MRDFQAITQEHKIYVVHLLGLRLQSCNRFHYDGEIIKETFTI
jgi:hypothetical protein